MMAATEAFEGMSPPLSLRLSDPVIGIDVSTARISLGVVHGEGKVDWATLPLAKGDLRLARLGRDLRGWLPQVDGQFGAPWLVIVEQPFGRNVPPVSYYFVGVVLGACQELWGGRAEVSTLPPPRWKRLALGDGHGGARKPEILRWAQAAGYRGRCEPCERGECKNYGEAHDEADAIGIATAGGVLIEQRRAGGDRCLGRLTANTRSAVDAARSVASDRAW